MTEGRQGSFLTNNPLTTRFAPNTEEWYAGWAEQDSYALEPAETTIKRIAIVGMKHRGISGKLLLDGPVTLVHDFSNSFDPNAIKVLYGETQVGWVPRHQTGLIHNQEFFQDGEDSSLVPKLISGPELFLYLVS